MKISRSGISLIVVLASLVAVGCSKDTGSTSGNQLLSDPLLLKLPPSAAGFAVFDLGGEGYKQFKNSPYAKTANAREAYDSIRDKLSAVGTSKEVMDLVQKLFDACGRIGLVSPEGLYTPEKVLRRTVFFAGPTNDQKQPVEFGVFAQAAAGIDLTQQSKVLRAALQEAGVETASTSATGGEGFSVTLKGSQARLYVGANSSVFGASASQSVVEALLSKESTTTLSTLQGLPEYKRAVANMPRATQPLMFAFTSLNRFEPLLEQIAKAEENAQFKPKELPVEALAIQSSFDKEYVHDAGVAVTARTESQAKFVKALETSTLPAGATKLPSDTAFSLSFDPRLLRSIDSLMAEIKASGDPSFVQQIELAQGITIGLRNNTSGAPIPDMLMSIDSSNREALNKSIESSLTALLSMVGQGASWQTKEISGNPTRFFSTLIGAGAYISAPKGSNILLIGTSEGIIKDLAASQSGQGVPLTNTLPAALKGKLASVNVALLYLNFVRIADVLDSIKSTLAMFTGGNSELNELLNASRIRSWGLATGSISYVPGAVLIHASMSSPSA